MNKIIPVKEVRVGISFQDEVTPVGRLAVRNHQIYFEYDATFIKKGIEISPFRLPLKSGVQSFNYNLFEGLPGVFNDSLPDGWGRLLFDRYMRSLGILPTDITPLDRLAYIGKHGLGALVFEPDYSINKAENDISLDSLAMQSQKVLEGSSDDVLAELITLNGSSAGARPKALIGVNETRDHIIHGVHALPDGYTPWIVKFPNSQDGLDAGAIEYVYALIAKEAGIVVPDIHLFSSERGAGYFAIKRFDRRSGKCYHMHTACGLLHSDFRTPSLDYEDLMALTSMLTRDIREVEKMFQLAVFNVFSHNRDDHSKNFTFLMDQEGQWNLAPGYDLTFSSGPGGEQSTMVMGEGRNPKTEHLLKLGKETKINNKRINSIIDQTKSSLGKWSKLAKTYGVSDANISFIQTRLDQIKN